MSLGEQLKYPMTSPNWMTNLLMGLVCMFIPFVGMMVLVGWLVECVHARILNPVLEGYPDFDFSKFSDYMKRGLMPTLALFLHSMILSLVYIPLSLGMVIPIVTMNNNPRLMFIIVLSIMFTIMILSTVGTVVMMVLSGPLMLRSGMSGAFADAFKLGVMFDVLKRSGGMVCKQTWYMLVLMMLFFIASFLLYFTIIGILLIYVLVIYFWIFWFHCIEKIYNDYLEKGGEPFPQNPDFLPDYADQSLGTFPGRPPLS